MGLFKFNPRIIPAIATHPVVIAQLKIKADTVAERARAIAPVRKGDYRDGIKSESGIVDGMGVGRVNANDFKSIWIEAGTTDTPTHAVLRRALDGLS